MIDGLSDEVIFLICAGAIFLVSMLFAIILPRGMTKLVVTMLVSLIYLHWAGGVDTELGRGGFVIWVPLVAFATWWWSRTGAHIVETLKS